MRLFILLALILGAFTPLSGCDDDTTETVGKRIASPDGRVEVVRVDRESGATVSDSVFVYVVPTGTKMSDFGTPSIRVHNYRDIQMKWKSNRNLDVIYAEAEVLEFNKTWSSPFVDSNRYEVTITLQKKP
ncbi:MAG: hypothetical protein H7Y38_04500 [Armatimonadetes bacterium]|nr:hypothetical protein [Armatimonadota bacterium]